MSELRVLPLAVVMVAGPQLLSAVFLATSDRWRANSAAYVLGAAVSITAVVALGYAFGDGAAREGLSGGTLDIVILVVLLVAMANVYRNRAKAEPPAWMGKLTGASPRFSFRLGFLLLGVFPTDILTAVAVGSFLSARGAPLTDAVPFVLATLLLLALPSLVLLAFGERGAAFMPRARGWMEANSWVVNEAVLLFFVALLLT
ncbi:GAP family protein [Halostella salina]|uniref:GAP family protein n=1 Tax=Halostella salina TaxID=1547897 RepID=UPI000EF84088|nr:GAP family protein [Halostella salina]